MVKVRILVEVTQEAIGKSAQNSQNVPIKMDLRLNWDELVTGCHYIAKR